jgi:hypothetical protein
MATKAELLKQIDDAAS